MTAADLELRVIQLLNEMEMLRRAGRLYPGGHPALAATRDRVAACARSFTSGGPVVAGFAPDELSWNRVEITVPPEAPASRILSLLFHLGLAGFRLEFPRAIEGLEALSIHLATVREPPGEADREELLDAAQDFVGVELVPLDLSTVQLVDEEEVTPGKPPRFLLSELVRRLAAGHGVTVADSTPAGRVAPELVRKLLQEVADRGALLDHLFGQVSDLVRESAGRAKQALLEEVRAFLSALLPLLDDERRALVVVVAMRHLPVAGDRSSGSEALVPPEQLLQAAEHMVHAGKTLPEAVQRLLYRLAAPRSEQPLLIPGEVVQRARNLLPSLPLGTDEVPASPNALDAEAHDYSEDMSWVHELRGALTESHIRLHLVRILSEAITLWPEEPVGERSALRLAEELVSSLDIGDLETAARLVPVVAAARSAEARRVACEGGVPAGVRALRTTDREHHAMITAILAGLGEPALPLLLEALGNEQGAAVRARLLEVVLRQGERAVSYLMPLVEDPRWYVARNAVFVLRRLRHAEAVPLLKARLPSVEPRVAAEILKALVAFEDPEWVAQLLRELDSPDEERQLAAIGVAAQIGHPPVVRAIAERLRQRITRSMRDERVTVELIRALGRLRDPAGLEVLRKVVEIRRLFAPASLATLRSEAAVAVAQLGGAEARRLAVSLARDRDPKVAQAVQAVLRRARGREEAK